LRLELSSSEVYRSELSSSEVSRSNLNDDGLSAGLSVIGKGPFFKGPFLFVTRKNRLLVDYEMFFGVRLPRDQFALVLTGNWC
jgi:hypothetical protein